MRAAAEDEARVKPIIKTIKNYKLSEGYQFSFEIIPLSKLFNLNIMSVDSICDYIGDRKTAPISYVFKATINIILTIILYRLAKKNFC